jgi:2-polyprenyl-3-methyl-5-hydroxy-6-metoxy-1,4-benzoquinol methylase
MKLVDHFKTKEKFELKYNKELEMYTTHPIPPNDKIGFYYEDDAYISHSNTIKSPMDFVYNLAKHYMLKQKFKWVKLYVRKGRFLDIGCGTGDFLWLLKRNKFEVIGVEPNPKARSITSEKGIEAVECIEYVQAHQFDAISLWHVLEHIPNLDQFFEHMSSILQKGGYMFVAVPNFKSFDAQYYKEFWAAFDVPRHIHHFSQYAIEGLFRQNGYQLLQTKGLALDAYYVSMLSEKYKGSHSFLNALRIGFMSNWKARKSNEWSSKLYIFRRLK